MQIGEVESGVELPLSDWKSIKFPTKGRPQNLLRHRIEELDVTQSFTINIEDNEDIDVMKERVRASSKHAASKTGRKFIVRKKDRTVTIWRVE